MKVAIAAGATLLLLSFLVEPVLFSKAVAWLLALTVLGLSVYAVIQLWVWVLV
jgi:hypothetical protein